MIRGHGPSTPSVILVADYPHGEDIANGYAIQGYKERVLREFARSAQFDFDSAYRTCLIKDPIPPIEDLYTGRRKLSEAAEAQIYNDKVVPQYAPFLYEEIKALEPNLIVPLGEISFQHLAKLQGIRKFRGSILRMDLTLGIEKYTKVLPILGVHPYINQEYWLKLISQHDFKKVPKWANDRPIPDDSNLLWIATSYTALKNFLNRAYPICEAKTLAEGGYLVFDIETYYGIPTCIGFCFDGYESVCVPLIDDEIDIEQRVLMAQLVAEVLQSKIPKVNQNIKFDWKKLQRHGFLVNNIMGDTMIGAAALYCEFPKNLGFLTSIYTDLPYFKDEGRQFDPSKHKRSQFYLYNAKDCLATHLIHRKQIEEIEEQGVRLVYDKMMQLLPIYKKAEDRGIRIDEEQRDRIITKYEFLFNLHTQVFNRLVNADHDMNPISSTVVNRLIFEILEYPMIRGVSGSDEDSLNMLIAKGSPKACPTELGKSILEEIITCRKLHKVIEVASLEIYPDGRFRAEANLAGTVTGRTSWGKTTDYYLEVTETNRGSKIKPKNYGHSFQNIGKHGFQINGTTYGKDLRSMFVPSVGYSFVEIDLASAEARVDQILAGNFDLSVFDNPGIHQLTGSWIFNVPPSEIVKGTDKYFLAKTFRHAAERNMQADRAFIMAQNEALGISLTLKECEIALKVLHEKQPGIKQVFHKDVEKAIKETRTLIAPNGRRRDFFDRINGQTINDGISQLPQSIVSDQTKFSFPQSLQECPWAHLLVESHDAGFFEIPKNREMEFIQVYRRNVETPIDFRHGSLKRDFQLTIPSEAAIGENWEDMKGVKE